jgi:hypothetical protein
MALSDVPVLMLSPASENECGALEAMRREMLAARALAGQRGRQLRPEKAAQKVLQRELEREMQLTVKWTERRAESDGSAAREMQAEVARGRGAQQELRRLRGLDIERCEAGELAALRGELEEALARVDAMARRRTAELVVAERMPSFLCPIGTTMMRDPVVAADGHSYERSAIARWVGRAKGGGAAATSPKTGLPLAHLGLVPNFALLASIDEAVEEAMRGAA